MVNDDHHRHPPHPLLRILVPFLGSDLFEVFSLLWRLGKRIFSAKAHEGMYEVLDLDMQLELKDDKGQHAVVTKREQVKYLQDNIIAYQDQAWGDGNIFVDYQCSPGVAVDRYRFGHRYRILISLRAVKKRGDSDVFHITRAIENGFTKPTEDFQIDINHPTHRAVLRIIFPASRLPKKVLLMEQDTTRMVPLNAENLQMLPDGRLQAEWSSDKPRLFESYTLRWEW